MTLRKPRRPDPPPEDEDTPERIQWYKDGIRRRREEVGEEAG